MIRYGDTYETAVQMTDQAGTLTLIKSKTQKIMHYPKTDLSVCIPQGKGPTRLSCVIITLTEATRIIVEQILHGDDEKNLYIGESIFFKKVRTGESPQMSPKGGNNKKWWHYAEFYALDPIPYDTDTGGALY